MRRLIEKDKNQIEQSDNMVVNFYEFEMFDESIMNVVKKNDKELDYSILFLLRIFWKIMSDTDKDGYDVKDWNFESYYDCFINNLDKVDLNQNSYRTYFKELVKYMVGELRVKTKNK